MLKEKKKSVNLEFYIQQKYLSSEEVLLEV